MTDRRSRALPHGQQRSSVTWLTKRAAALVERLLLDLARLGYGDDVALDYIDAADARTIHDTFGAYARAGYRVETDFGDTCAVTAYFADDDRNVLVELDLEDRSVVCSRSGCRTTPSRAKWRVQLVLDSACERILGLSVGPAG